MDKVKQFLLRYIYIELTLVLVIVASIISVRHSAYMRQSSIEQSFEVLDEYRNQIGQMIANEMNNEQGHIESAAKLLADLIPEYEDNKELIVKVMDASSREVGYTHWELCFPDGHVIKDDGKTLNLGDKYSFADRVSKDITVSERRTALRDGKTQIIMLSECIFKEDQCIGILSSVIDLDKFASGFVSASEDDNSKVMIFERGTGDILVDDWHEELRHVDDIQPPESQNGYNWEEVKAGYKSGQSGHAALKIQKSQEVMYITYAPIPYSDWQLSVFSPESVCMATAYSNRVASRGFTIKLAVTFIIYLGIIIVEEKRRNRIKAQQEIQLKKALDEANAANAAKSRFLSKMSHDIRTPLNAILGLIDLSETNKGDTEALAQNRRKAKIAARHLLSLVNDVLNMSKLEDDSVELAHEAFDVRVLARDILTIMQARADEEGINLVYEKSDADMENPYVYGSPLHLRQIFLNILSNSIKYNKKNGSIMVSLEQTRKENGKVWYRCRIKDTGIGMSPEFLKHLFDPFSQEKVDARSVYLGSGLGMSITKSLIDKMGGTIDVTSIQGEGSEFVVEIPFDIADESDVNISEPLTDSCSIEGIKVLLAEDNDLNREIAKALLVDRGAVVTTARDGQEVLDIFNSSQPGGYDVVLMDVMMPVMDGIEATKHIRKLDRKDATSIPIIAFTANAFYDDVNRCLEAGMNAHLAKPIDVDKMVATIAQMVNK